MCVCVCFFVFFLRDSVSGFQTVGPKTEKKKIQNVSRGKCETLSREVSRERNVLRDEGEKYKMAYCSDRYTENRDRQFCTES